MREGRAGAPSDARPDRAGRRSGAEIDASGIRDRSTAPCIISGSFAAWFAGAMITGRGPRRPTPPEDIIDTIAMGLTGFSDRGPVDA